MARKPVAANLLMAFLIIGGVVFAFRIKQEVFPEFTVDRVSISVPYPGASPAEVEQGIVLSIEDVVRGLDGVKEVISNANEGAASISVELLTGADSAKALQDVKNAVDRIRSFPEEAERPVVNLTEARRQVLTVIVHGLHDERVLRALAERTREDLLRSSGITLVELADARRLEIAIEVPQERLRSYNLTLDGIARIVRSTALELPAGAVRTEGGEILLRTQERRDFALDFGNIPVATTAGGALVFLGDIATIRDTFEETDQEAFYNGERALGVDVYRVGDETPQSVSAAVLDYVASVTPDLPEGVNFAVWNDQSEIYRDRMQLLLKNAVYGLLLVLVTLGLFLDPKLAFWVTAGIPTSIIGAFLLLPLLGASLNMISLFAFIVTLGIVVDDAIVVGENIYEKRERGMPFLQASIEGARDIAGPVVFAVLTNILSFLPLFFVPGAAGNFFRQIPSVVVMVLAVSLIESLFVLPAHLSHRTSDSLFWRLLSLPNAAFDRGLKWFIRTVYTPTLVFLLKWRYATIAFCIGCLVIAIGFVRGGYVGVSFLPRIEADVVTASATLPFGVPVERTRQVQERLLESLDRVTIQHGGSGILRGIYTQIGSAAGPGAPHATGKSGAGGSHLLNVRVALVPADERDIGGVDFSNSWREATGPIAGLELLAFQAQVAVGEGSPIDIELSHGSIATLEEAAAELAEGLRTYAGVTDVDDGFARGKPQISFQLKQEARSLGITVADLASQVRSSFYGAEALRQQRGRNEVKVMVRLPQKERETLNTVENLILRTPRGGEVPLLEAAVAERGFSYTEIRRKDARRTINVTADVNDDVTNSNQVLQVVEANDLPALLRRYPGLSYSLTGESESQRDTLDALGVGFVLALFGIFALLAVGFNSYVQPLIIMVSIPFGIVGVIAAHYVLGFDLSMISFFGLVALAGIVINDSLVLVVTANRIREERGATPYEAVLGAGARRFRPILLTTMTTVLGLTPMILETSMQARFLIPMALSIAGGEIFSTVILLVLVPSLYLVVEDIHGLASSGWSRLREAADPVQEPIFPAEEKRVSDRQAEIPPRFEEPATRP